MKAPKNFDEFIAKHAQWEPVLKKLRTLILSTSLNETIKWGIPVYTFGGKNIIGLGPFKSYVGLWFYQGVFLKDKQQKLINAQEGKTKALRQWRFSSEDEIEEQTVTAYILEAIENHKQGKEILPDRRKPLVLPKELIEALENDKDLKNCFSDLSKGRQREYAEYISDAKRTETKQKRIEKIIPMIFQRSGLNDRYR